MDRERFQAACRKITAAQRERKQIGTLGEKTLHAVLKEYLSPHEGAQEVKLGSYYADIADENGITEIQTRCLGNLRKKLSFFLSVSPVTVVYPIPRIKYLVWVDPETGEASARRKSPKTGKPWDCFRELYTIKQFLKEPGLRVRLLMVDLCEYRSLNGWSADRKKGSVRLDRIPLDLGDEILLTCPADYRQLLPPDLPEEFTSADFRKKAKLSQKQSFCALNLLTHMGICRRTGKKGRSYLYRLADNDGISEESHETER